MRTLVPLLLLSACAMREGRLDHLTVAQVRSIEVSLPVLPPEGVPDRVQRGDTVYCTRIEGRGRAVIDPPDAACRCDLEEARCVVAPGAERLQICWQPTAGDWPRADGLLATCTAGDHAFPVHARLAHETRDHPWWASADDLVAPVTAAPADAVRTWTVPLPESVPATARGVASPGTAACHVDALARTVEVKVWGGHPPRVAPCLTWPGTTVTLHIVPTTPLVPQRGGIE